MNDKDQHSPELIRQILDLHQLVAEQFHHQFMTSIEAEPVRKYWCESRGFSLKCAEAFKIGYAPASKNFLKLLCKDHDISPLVMNHSGLFYSSKGDSNCANLYTRFRGRLMIPIQDIPDRVIAFSARHLEQTPEDDLTRKAKYINSPSTPIFDKGKILFGLNHAISNMQDGDGYILVEGQLDAIRCWSLGLNTAIAVQGTSLTQDQLSLIKHSKPNYVECLLDGDKAGQKAAARYAALSIKTGLNFCFFQLPEKSDPDEFLRLHGKEGYDTERKNNQGAVYTLITSELPDRYNLTTCQKVRALESLFQVLKDSDSNVITETHIKTAARILNVSNSAAMEDFKGFKSERD